MPELQTEALPWPNPTSGRVSFNNPGLARLLDASGVVLWMGKGSGTMSVDLGAYPSGPYVLELWKSGAWERHTLFKP